MKGGHSAVGHTDTISRAPSEKVKRNRNKKNKTESLVLYKDYDDDIHLEVQQPEKGFWVNLSLVAKIPMSCDEIFDIITSPHNHEIFHSVDKPRERRVIKDNGRGRQEVDMEQVGRWRFGPFKGSFGVKLRVIQDRNAGRMTFKLRNQGRGYMKQFEGEWDICRYSGELEDELLNPGKIRSSFYGVNKLLHSVEESIVGRHKRESLIRLKQAVQPGFLPPPPLDRILRKIAAAQVKTVIKDLMIEAEKRSSMSASGRKERAQRYKQNDVSHGGEAGSHRRWSIIPFLESVDDD